MNAIKLNFNKSNNDLFGQSKWWGAPDLPEGMDMPMIPFEDGDDDPMTMICQIRCADLAEIDPGNLLPHTGMLYFFAAIDEYVGALHKERPMNEEFDDEFEYEEDLCHNGLGEWPNEAFKVLYSPTENNLKTHGIIGPDGEPYELPAERITFVSENDGDSPDFKLLGMPYFEELSQWYPEYINLLQIDENEDWGMTFYDCGMINFLIKPEDLKARRFDKAIMYFHSL